MSTKIHATVDALGNPTGFHLTGGQEHDLAGADALLPELEAETLIADKAFDADQRVLEPLAEAGKTAVIPPRTTRKTARAFDKDLYKARHLIENFFAKLKQFRAIATRSLRQDRAKFPGRHSPGRRSHLAQLRTRPSNLTAKVLLVGGAAGVANAHRELERFASVPRPDRSSTVEGASGSVQWYWIKRTPMHGHPATTIARMRLPFNLNQRWCRAIA